MELGVNEYTISSFLNFLRRTKGKKVSGKEFTKNDVAQYCMRGYLPWRYGGNKLESYKVEGVKIIRLIEN